MSETDELKLYTRREVSERTHRSESSIRDDMREPGCPLVWTHKAGRQNACDAETLRAYMDWLRVDRTKATG